MSEWLAVEAIIRQRDKEKASTTSQSGDQEKIASDLFFTQQNQSLSNEVFIFFIFVYIYYYTYACVQVIASKIFNYHCEI